MNDMNSLKERLRIFLEEKVQEAAQKKNMLVDLADNFELLGTGLIDSISFLGIITEIEQKFNIEIDFSEKDPNDFKTINGFIECALECV